MKSTLMFLMVSALLAFSLTACGGDSQNGTAGQTDGAISGGSSITDGGSGSANNGNGSVNGGNGSVNSGTGSASGGNGSVNNGTGSVNGSNGTINNGTGSTSDGSLADDARGALDDAGRAVRNTVDDIARDF